MQREAKITSKGQITVPREVRHALGVKPGDKIVFEKSENDFTHRLANGVLTTTAPNGDGYKMNKTSRASPTLGAKPPPGAIVLFDVATRQLLGEPLAGHSGNVFSVAFTGDGTRVASAGADGRVLLWNVELWANEDALRKRACDLVGRNLTSSEWKLYLPGKSYRRTCDEWPAGT